MNKLKQKRELTQITCGKLLEILYELDEKRLVKGFSEPHSYRGIYRDISFEPSDETRTVKELISLIENNVIDRNFIGYRGGTYKMSHDTSIWIAYEGTSHGGYLTNLDSTIDPIELVIQEKY